MYLVKTFRGPDIFGMTKNVIFIMYKRYVVTVTKRMNVCLSDEKIPKIIAKVINVERRRP